MIFGNNKKITGEDFERVVLVVKKFSNFRIHLQNKILNLVKFPMLNCTNIDLSKDDFMLLKNESFEVESESILLFLLEKRVEGIDLIEYYRFFRRIGAHLQMKMIIERVEAIRSFEECASMFILLEEDLLKGLVSCGDPRKTMKPTIPTLMIASELSLTLSVFNRLRDLSHQLDLKPYLFVNPYIGIINYLLKNKNEKVNVYEHKDFEEINGFDDINSINVMMKMFYFNHEDNKERYHSNIVVYRENNINFFCAHMEILILRSNFFFRLFRNDFSECIDFRKKGRVTVEDMKSKEDFQDFIQSIYVYRLSSTKLTLISFIRQVIFADKFFEEEYKTLLMKANCIKRTELTNKDIMKSLSSVGYLLHCNKKLKRNVLSMLVRCYDYDSRKKATKKFLALIKRSFEREEIRRLKEENKRLIEENNEQKELLKKKDGIIRKLKEENKKLFLSNDMKGETTQKNLENMEGFQVFDWWLRKKVDL